MADDLQPTRPEHETRRLRIVEHYLIPTGPQAVQLRSANRVTGLKGASVDRTLPQLLPLLDGSLTGEQIVERTAPTLGAGAVRGVLKVLAEKGFIEEVGPVDAGLFPDGSEAQFASLSRFLRQTDQTGSGYRSLVELRKARIVIADRGGMGPAMVSALSHLGVGAVTVVAADPEAVARAAVPRRPGATTVVGTGPWPVARTGWAAALEQARAAVVLMRGPVVFEDQLLELNAAAIETGTTWLVVSQVAPDVLQVGPTFYPGSSACLACFRQQLQRSVSFLESWAPLAQAYAGTRSAAGEASPVMEELGAAFAAVEVMRAISLAQPPVSVGQVITIDLRNLNVDRYKVLRVPRCPECGHNRHAPMMRIWG